MQGHWSRRAMLTGFGTGGAALFAAAVEAQDRSSGKSSGAQVTTESLGTLLKAIGVSSTLKDKRYDFVFKTPFNDNDWDLSMSAVLSEDGESIWIMAWLDALPKSAADVPRTALLRLLADNDKLGKGKFFAYIAANRRFVLQRVIPNIGITSAGFRGSLEDLGQSVVETHAHWAVSNWSQQTSAADDPANAPKTDNSAPASSARSGPKAPQSAINDSKFNSGARK